MNPRRKYPPVTLLRTLLALWMLASMASWISGVHSSWNIRVHWDRQIRNPLFWDFDSHRVTFLQPEAIKAGLARGDVIHSLNGAPYTGVAQWHDILSQSRPGDILEIGYSTPAGRTGTALINLRRETWAFGKSSAMLVFWREFVIVSFLPLVCLLIGYWVVLSRPTDRNAWLLLVLLTFPSVVFIGVFNAHGLGLLLRSFWHYTILFAAGPALFLFGVYFPERSRLDARLPWLKWLLLAVFAVAFAFLYPSMVVEYYFGGDGRFLTRASDIAGPVISYLNLLFLLLYIALTVHKLVTATSADTRRRLRVLIAGMSIGMGAMLIVFFLLPRFGINGFQPRWFWLRYLGGALFMLAPLTLTYVIVVQRALDLRVILRIGTRYALARASLWVLQAALVVVVILRLLLPAMQSRQPGPSDFAWAALFLLLVLAFRFGVSRSLQKWLDRRFFREAYNAELMLNELSDEVSRFTETQPLLETVARRIADTLHVTQLALFLRRGDAFHIECALGIPADATLTLPAQASSVRYLVNSSQPARLYRNDPDAWYLMAGTAERRLLDQLNAELILPLPGRNRLMGVMTLGPKRSEAAWSRTDLQLLQTLARQTGLTLEVSELAHSLAAEAAQRERVNREIEIAREVQERLFPQQMPDIPGASIAGSCRPALGVGGDYYDVISLEDGRVGLAVGDVSGKGISAALLMASLRASLRGITLDTPRDFANLMHKVNRLVYEASASNRYATFFFAAFDPKTRRLDCVNAGHNPPILLRDGQIIRLQADGPVVGLLPFAPYTEQTLTLEPGDLLILYTDGISEAMNPSEEEWGEERMIATLSTSSRTAPETLQALFAAADAFTSGAPQHDDMTLLILRLDPQPALTPKFAPGQPQTEMAAP